MLVLCFRKETIYRCFLEIARRRLLKLYSLRVEVYNTQQSNVFFLHIS